VGPRSRRALAAILAAILAPILAPILARFWPDPGPLWPALADIGNPAHAADVA